MIWVKDGLYYHHFVNADGEILATLTKQFGAEKTRWGQREFINLSSGKKIVERELEQKK